MLERLQIQNFQAHDKLRIDFDPHITCIIGTDNDVGKSAIIRALRWVCTNEPGGGAFVRHGTKGTTVRLLVDGHTITRRRSASGDVNTYELDGQEYKAFGRGVPEPIARLLNVTPTCWQGQHDAPFWFGETAGEVSRQLNAIVNLGIIDDTLAGVARTLNHARTRLEVAETDLTAAKKEYDATAWVADAEAALANVESERDAYIVKRDRAARVAGFVRVVHNARATHERATRAASVGETMVDAGVAAKKARGRVDLLNDLTATARIHTTAARVKVPDITKLERAYAKYNEVQNRWRPLQILIDSIHAKEGNLCQLEKELKKAEKAVPRVCPTCGRSS